MPYLSRIYVLEMKFNIMSSQSPGKSLNSDISGVKFLGMERNSGRLRRVYGSFAFDAFFGASQHVQNVTSREIKM